MFKFVKLNFKNYSKFEVVQTRKLFKLEKKDNMIITILLLPLGHISFSNGLMSSLPRTQM
jgi:hypothetical protein